MNTDSVPVVEQYAQTDKVVNWLQKLVWCYEVHPSHNPVSFRVYGMLDVDLMWQQISSKLPEITGFAIERKDFELIDLTNMPE